MSMTNETFNGAVIRGLEIEIRKMRSLIRAEDPDEDLIRALNSLLTVRKIFMGKELLSETPDEESFLPL